jgi:hypothetical protein
MTLRFAYTRPDGGISIVNAARKQDIEQRVGKLTDAQYRAHVRGRSIPPDATDVVELPADWSAPADRTFRDAWRLTSGKIEHDMAKAKAIHRDRLRAQRAPLLAALDVEYQRADEKGDTEKKQAIAKRKQALRDVTADPAIELADTPDALKAVIPAALKAQQ